MTNKVANITQEMIEEMAIRIPEMDGNEQSIFNENVLNWWMKNRGIDPHRDAEKSVEFSGIGNQNRHFNDRSSKIDFGVIWDTIEYTTRTFNPDIGFAYIQQFRNALKDRNYEIPDQDDLGLQSHGKHLRRLRRERDKYNESGAGRISDDMMYPDWFLEEYIERLSENNKISLESLKSIIVNTPSSVLPIGVSASEDEGDDALISIDPQDDSVPDDDLVVFVMDTTDMFIDVVKKGGPKKREVFEKINANVVFDSAIADTRLSIRYFWDYVHHEYVEFFESNTYDPIDTTIIFHHWFYSDEFPVYTVELSRSSDWASKKANFSTTYRKQYVKHCTDHKEKFM